MKLSIFAAISENDVIGRRGGLPWRLPDELAYLKRTTMGHTLIMGRKTYESIGRPLPGRTSIVVTRQADYQPHPEVVVVNDFARGLEAADERGESELFVFGGESIYREALPGADRLYITRVHAQVEGDTFFPQLSLADWKLIREETHEADERHAYPFSLCVYERA
ncbi:MAG: dihydrofolate reductase [bacterium]|nr:dihydrofolate reductase [bacterium]